MICVFSIDYCPSVGVRGSAVTVARAAVPVAVRGSRAPRVRSPARCGSARAPPRAVADGDAAAAPGTGTGHAAATPAAFLTRE
jgi:hypothetical protein